MYITLEESLQIFCVAVYDYRADAAQLPGAAYAVGCSAWLVAETHVIDIYNSQSAKR